MEIWTPMIFAYMFLLFLPFAGTVFYLLLLIEKYRFRGCPSSLIEYFLGSGFFIINNNDQKKTQKILREQKLVV